MSHCKVRGCQAPPAGELEDQSLCLEHFLDEVQSRSRGFSRRLESQDTDEPLRQAALQFILVTAAKIATIGINSPPEEQLARGRLLNAMLELADLRDRLDRFAVN